MEEIRVAHVITSLRKGGAERLVIDICYELTRRSNIKHLIITLEDGNDYLNFTSNLNIIRTTSFVTLSISKKAKFDTTDFFSIIKNFNPHIIHSHLLTAEILSRETLFPKIKYITHLHGYEGHLKNFNFLTFFNKKLVTNFYEKQRLIKKFKASNNFFISISKYVDDKFLRTFPKSLHKHIILHNAIDFGKFNNPKKNYALDFRKFVQLISVGSFSVNKNQIFLVDVVKILHLKRYKVKLILLGDGVNKSNIEKKIYDYNLADYITLKGNVSNVEDYLHDSNIYIHSAFQEAFGLVLLEAMAAGLPVVTLDGKGNRDIIEQGKNGFMIYEKKAELFAEKIIELIENKELYHSMSSYAVEYAKKYDIKDYVDKLLEIYKNVLQF